MSNLSSSELLQLKMIEERVNSYLSSKSMDMKNSITNVLSRALSKSLLPSKQVNIIWNFDARSPFIMSITPDISELYDKSEKLNKLMDDPKTHNMDVIKTWAEIDHWYLEIDSRVLTKGDRLCVDDGAEFVALLCHEIGHVMTENPLRLLYNYKVKSLNFSTLERMMLSNSKIVRSIMLPMYTHTLQFMIVCKDRNDNKECEKAADSYVPDEYKGALVAYMNNHLLQDPEASNMVVDREDFDNMQCTGIKLSKESIGMLKDRRDVLNRSIQNQYNSKDNGVFHKKLMKFIGRNLTGYNPDEDKYITSLKVTMENAFNREYATLEAKANSIIDKNSKVTQRELDVLEIQADDVKTPEDKMYMIHKVYDYIEAIDAENIKKAKKMENIPKEIRDNRLDRLNAIRTKLLATKVSDTGDKYGIFVKYPAGYEG